MEFSSSIYCKDVAGGSGIVEFENNVFVLRQKSRAVRLAFGVIGAALDHGKEVMRFPISDVVSYRTDTGIMREEIYLSLKDGKEVKFTCGSYFKDICKALDEALAANSNDAQNEPLNPAAPPALSDAAPEANPVASTGDATVDAFLASGVPMQVIEMCLQLSGDRQGMGDFVEFILREGMVSMEEANQLMDYFAPEC